MDPQHRMILEQSYARLAVGADAASREKFAVFVGIAGVEYGQSALRYGGYNVGVYSATGANLSVAAGRLSYIFGLKGPSISIDTACSSSLVSAHIGFLCRGMRRGTDGGC